LAKLHDRAFAKGAFDLAKGGVEGFLFIHQIIFDNAQG
jgi:hypothetical protein